MLKRINW